MLLLLFLSAAGFSKTFFFFTREAIIEKII